MNQVIGAAYRRALHLQCNQSGAQTGEFVAVVDELRVEMTELLFDMFAQFTESDLDAVVLGQLLNLAGLHPLERGQDDVGEQSRDSVKDFVHEEILRTNIQMRTITDTDTHVMARK